MKYIIEGAPIPCARARATRGGRVYDSQKRWKLSYGITISSQHGSLPLYEGPLHLEVVFYFPMPEKWTPKQKQEREGSWFIIRPDKDNCVKMLMDCCNGILYPDDCLICSSIEKKLYSQNPRTEFTIVEIK